MRIIDADRAKEIAEVSLGDIFLQTALKLLIDKVPTIDAVEVVHGEWNTVKDDYFGLVALECSVCNNQWWFEDDASFGKYHYCPNCGAKMDGEK